jgi:uncharacterized protein with FMN-binding domain
MIQVVRQTLTATLITAGLVPAGNALAARQGAVAVKKFAGPAVSMRWGPVQVTIKVKGKKIVNVVATAPTDRTRSAFINGQALLLLKAEVLKAQSTSVSIVAGATMTSQAYLKSLRAAMVKAQLP